MVDRHGSLRTEFAWEGISKPVQVVRKGVKVKVRRRDWRGMDGQEQSRRLEQYLEKERREGFELRRAPLMSLALIRLEETKYEFIWTHHHLLLDGWSYSLVLKEVLSSYEGYVRGEEVRVEEVRPYRDYIEWLSKQDKQKAEEYWSRQMKGVTAATPLGIDKREGSTGRQEQEGERYGEQQRRITEETTRKLVGLGRQEQVTMNTIVQGAWSVVLSRYSGQEEVVYGATVSGRPGEMKGVERMVGVFINTLPVRVKVESKQEVREWLKQMQSEQVEMRQYEYSGLMEVQGWSEMARGVAMFDSIFVFENYPVDKTLTEQQWGVEVNEAESYERYRISA